MCFVVLCLCMYLLVYVRLCCVVRRLRFTVVSVCCVCFFFKQKTAYEMRISDWSSDVCSSDLRLHGFHRDSARRIPICGRRQGRPHTGYGTHEIGRASCRERVCQYV